MGAWSTSINGNDTAEDLRMEYTCAFFKYEPEERVKLLDEYVKREHIADEIKNRALQMIDSGYGLEIWEESSGKTLKERKKVLEKFREKITSPQPERKKIKETLIKSDVQDCVCEQAHTPDFPSDCIKISQAYCRMSRNFGAR